MQINMPDSGTFLFISDHCHVIENVSIRAFSNGAELTVGFSGVMASHKVGWQETIRLGSAAHSA